MRVIIRISAKDSTKAWALLASHSAGTALPDRTFIVSPEAVRALHDAGIRFTEISRDESDPAAEGVQAGERI